MPAMKTPADIGMTNSGPGTQATVASGPLTTVSTGPSGSTSNAKRICTPGMCRSCPVNVPWQCQPFAVPASTHRQADTVVCPEVPSR